MPESRSLSELTRQIAPPTKNGHAPPPTESRKSYQSVNPFRVRAGKRSGPLKGTGHPAKGIRGAPGRQGLGQAVARLAADRQPTPEIQLRAF
ncbi:hypothetical protein HF521_011834 [Silurus meridionalis]|uniref:Uncharacterized protein n=1 Tax=Silurus meridionalis TaxID=175797 RepID=A0A8T0AD50_SILME|nr:hypothetical protein HF521_011834 [Silurus meridionalis]